MLKTFKPVDPGLPSTLGTRCHELTMYVGFANPLVMLCDSPDVYRKYPDILKYLSAVPTTWDDTRVLNAKVGEYVVLAKQKGKIWYVGGMNAWNERQVTSSFSFLKKGKKYRGEIFKDTDRSNENANLYAHETVEVDSNTSFQIRMASGGGFVLIIHEE